MWRAVTVLCLVPRTAPGGRAESLRLHQCTDQCTHSGAGDFSCPFHELSRNWALEGGRFPRAPKFPTKNPVLGECQGKTPSMPSALGSSCGLLLCLLETHHSFPSTLHTLREISFQGQLSMVLPQIPTVFYPHSTACPTPDLIKQCDEHPSHEHLSSPFLPWGRFEWE